MSAHAGALEAVDRILNRGGAPDDVLRAVADVLHERLFAHVAVVTHERVRAEAGAPTGAAGLAAPIAAAGELRATPREPSAADGALLARVALLLSPYAG